MAVKVLQIRTSDLSGVELPEGEGESIEFSIGSDAYRLDLTSKEAEAFHKTLSKYVEVATRVTKTSSAGKRSSGPRRDLAKVREWARENGFEVAERGRVPKEILEAFDTAQ